MAKFLRLRDVCKDGPEKRCGSCGDYVSMCICCDGPLKRICLASFCPLLALWEECPMLELPALPHTGIPTRSDGAEADEIVAEHFMRRVRVRVEDAKRAVSSQICWLYFNWTFKTGDAPVVHLTDFVMYKSRASRTAYVGVTQDPLWRMHRKSTVATPQQHRNSMVAHVSRFGPKSCMHVLAANGAHEIGCLERRLIDECGSWLQNKKGGGGGISSRADNIYFLYLVTCLEEC